MHTTYPSLSPEARVWIYQCDRLLNDSEIKDIQTLLDEFVAQWTAHGEPVSGYTHIYHRAFLVLMADSFVSGCSIDSSVRVIKEIGQRYGIQLFNRLNVAYQQPDGVVHIVSRSQFEQLLAGKLLSDDTIVFNNLVATKSVFETEWRVPLYNSSLV